MTNVLEEYLQKYNLQNYVYPHQKDAIEWMYDRCSQRKGSLLADDMGLGKTLDICVLLQLILARTVLIMCTTTCIYSQWVVNLCKHSFYYRVYVLESHKVRQIMLDRDGNIIKSDLMPLSVLKHEPGVYKVVVSNTHRVVPHPAVSDRPGMKAHKYEMSRPLKEYDPELTPLNEIIWDVVIIDEIHCIRNGVNTRLDPGETRKKMLRYHRLSRLRMTPDVGIRIGLTGTPIQNRISDVVSILSFLGKEFPPRCSEEVLKSVIKEYMFRRTGNDLHPALRSLINYPEVEYLEISKDVVYETQAEADIYRIVAGKLCGENIPGSSQNPYSNVQYEEKALVRTNRECYLSADINMFIKIHNNTYSNLGIFLPYWYGSQSKMNMIANDIAILAMENTSFICFVHFYDEMAAVKEKIYEKGLELGLGNTMGYEYFEISGEIDPEDRYVVLKDTERLIKEGKRCICFATIQTCSDGLNMQYFDTAIFTTSDWNPANEDQAIARIYRPGQKKRVKIYRYIHRYIIDSENTKHIDIKKLDRQNIKKGKADNYISNVPNAACDWPIRDMEGFEGEKCINFSTFEEFSDADPSIRDNYSVLGFDPLVRPPDIPYFENLLEGSGRTYKVKKSSGKEVADLVDNFYKNASLATSSSGGVINQGNNQTTTIEGMIKPETIQTHLINSQGHTLNENPLQYLQTPIQTSLPFRLNQPSIQTPAPIQTPIQTSLPSKLIQPSIQTQIPIQTPIIPLQTSLPFRLIQPSIQTQVPIQTPIIPIQPQQEQDRKHSAEELRRLRATFFEKPRDNI